MVFFNAVDNVTKGLNVKINKKLSCDHNTILLILQESQVESQVLIIIEK